MLSKLLVAVAKGLDFLGITGLKVERRREPDLACGRCGEADRTKGEHGLGRCVTFRYK